MSDLTERSKRLTDRFNAIRQSLEHVLRKSTDEQTAADQAYAACTVAWLEGIEYFCLLALRKANRDPKCISTSPEELQVEIRYLLQSFHTELCHHLGVQAEEAIRQSKAFAEVVEDICKERG